MKRRIRFLTDANIAWFFVSYVVYSVVFVVVLVVVGLSRPVFTAQDRSHGLPKGGISEFF